MPAACKQCGADAILVSVPNPCGRPPSTGGPWCSLHGGLDRAWREVRRDWNFLAPESVGGAAEVLVAGKRHLDTTHAYLVVRPEKGGVWLAWLGVGSKQVPVLSGVRDGAASYAFRDEVEARRAGIAAWELRLAEAVASIREARGGTLAWGEPVEPLPEPVVLAPARGSAWEAARAQPRRSKMTPWRSGLLPTGEVLWGYG